MFHPGMYYLMKYKVFIGYFDKTDQNQYLKLY